jgi:hypothetical protein
LLHYPYYAGGRRLAIPPVVFAAGVPPVVLADGPPVILPGGGAPAGLAGFDIIVP